MLLWSDVLVAEERIAEMRRQAEHERLVHAVLARQSRRPRFYHTIVVRFGGWMELVGQRLQQRYSVIVEPTLTSKIETTQGC